MKTEQDYHMFDWWKKVFIDNYANFNGRARRSEYWYFTLVNLLILIPLFIISTVFAESEMFLGAAPFILMAFTMLALIIPSIAVTVRRLHDTNKSGWFYVMTLVPLLSIVIFIFTLLDGDNGTNDYGKDPKNPYNNEEFNQIGTE
jgi:uncharacterized membrane protein YhaH (DUF805 family)